MNYCLMFTSMEESLGGYEMKKNLYLKTSLIYDVRDVKAKVLYDKQKKKYVADCLAINVNWKKSKLRKTCSFSFFYGFPHCQYSKKELRDTLEEASEKFQCFFTNVS